MVTLFLADEYVSVHPDAAIELPIQAAKGNDTPANFQDKTIPDKTLLSDILRGGNDGADDQQ